MGLARWHAPAAAGEKRWSSGWERREDERRVFFSKICFQIWFNQVGIEAQVSVNRRLTVLHGVEATDDAVLCLYDLCASGLQIRPELGCILRRLRCLSHHGSRFLALLDQLSDVLGVGRR